MTLKEVVDSLCKEDLPPLRQLVDSLDVDEDFVKSALENAIQRTYFEIKRFNVFRKRAKETLDKNKKCQKSLEKGLKEQKELDEVYDVIEYTENKIVTRIMKNRMLYMLFQYPIFAASSKISRINSVEFTFETLKENLIIQEELLEIVELYCRKSMKVFYEGFIQLQNEIMSKKYDIDISLFKTDWIEKHITSDDLEVEQV